MSVREREEMRCRLRSRLRRPVSLEVSDIECQAEENEILASGRMDNLMKNVAIWLVIVLVLVTVYNYFGAEVHA